MNVILIISDTLRRDFLGCYGNAWIHTPYIDRFARDAIRFDRAYCSSYGTVLCRNDIMTGRWTCTYKQWGPLGTDEIILAEVLNEAGYLTALFADTPHPFKPGFNYQRGFQAWELIRGQYPDTWRTAPAEVALPCSPEKLKHDLRGATRKHLQNVAHRFFEEDYFPAQTMRAAARWLEENRRRPFFLYVDTFDPHEPWDPPAHYLERYEPGGYQGESVINPRYDRWADFLTEAELQHCRHLYAGEVGLVDRWIGFLLERVEDLGLLHETTIIIASDHGFFLGEHGYIGKSLIRGRQYQSLPLYPELNHVPLLVRLPGGHGTRHSQAFAQPVDFMPTILDLLEVPIPATVQGRSLVSAFTGDDSIRPFAVSAPMLSHPKVKIPHPAERATITTPEWSMVVGAHIVSEVSKEMTSDIDGVPHEIAFLEGPFTPELYHLPSDPGCTRNVLAEHTAVARGLHSDFVAFLREVGMREDHLAYFAALPPELRD